MTSQALSIANQIQGLSDAEIDFLWDHLRKRRESSLLAYIDLKLQESMDVATLTQEEAAMRLKKLGHTASCI